MKSLFKILGIACYLLMATNSLAVETSLIQIDKDNELEINVYKASGSNLLIWFPSGSGLTKGLEQLAENLQQHKIEIWIPDPFASWFLPVSRKSLEQVPTRAYVAVIKKAFETGKNIFIASNDSGTKLMLEAARGWQLQDKGSLHGAVLVSPELHFNTPIPGEVAEFAPITEGSNLPIFILMPTNSVNFLRSHSIKTALKKGGSDVFLSIIPEVRDRYFYRKDATEFETKTAQELASLINQSLRLLATLPLARKPVPLKTKDLPKKKNTNKLVEFKGKWHPPPLELKDLEGKTIKLTEYKDKVYLINFWASWCPPCVHEMPSLSELQKFFSDSPFSILAINLGEEPQAIKDFLKIIPKAHFRILLDPEQAQSKAWKVFAFPTSYLVDKNGKIRYAIAGGTDWNTPEIKKIISYLLTR